LELNCIVVENNRLTHQVSVKHPSKSGKTCHLEDLWRVALSQ
jgi:hypothetical protein